MATVQATILIPDISGYTSFISQMEIEHGAHIISELIESLLHLTPEHYYVSEIEGDAVLLYSKDRPISKKELIDDCQRLFESFHQRRQMLAETIECTCNACAGIEKLSLKFVAHYGPIFEQQINRFLKPSGVNMIIAHRLLKNKIPSQEYLLITNEFLAQATDAGEEYSRAWEAHQEEFEVIGKVDCKYTLIAL